MSNQDIVRGRQVVIPLVNRTGGTISAGDVVVTDTANNESFTSSSSSNYSTTRLGIAQETIGITSNGRVLVEGYAPLVSTTGSVTRGLGVYHSTTSKKAQDGAQKIEGQFGEFLSSSATPSAIIFPTVLTAASSSYASNSNDVAGVGAAGASTLLSRADHVHKGVTAVAHASNSFSGTVTLTTPGNTVSVTSPSSGTFALQSTGGGGGGAASSLVSASYTRTAGSYTTTSTTFVDVDATNLALTISTGARRVMVTLSCEQFNDTIGSYIYVDVDLDGTRLANQANGIVAYRSYSADWQPLAFTWVTDALSAGSHTFKLQWRVNSGTGNMYGAGSAWPLRFSVVELYA